MMTGGDKIQYVMLLYHYPQIWILGFSPWIQDGPHTRD